MPRIFFSHPEPHGPNFTRTDRWADGRADGWRYFFSSRGARSELYPDGPMGGRAGGWAEIFFFPSRGARSELYPDGHDHHDHHDHHIGPGWTIFEHIGPYWTILEHIAAHWAILGHIGPCWTILDHTGPYWTMLDHI